MDIIGISSISLIIFGLVFLVASAEKSKREKRLDKLNIEKTKQERKPKFVWLTQILNTIFSTNQKEIDEKFISAGFYDLKFAKYYVLVKYTAVILGTISVAFWGTLWQLKPSSFIAVEAVWIIVSLTGPDSFLSMRASNLRKSISNKLPYMLDLMSVSIQTGMTIEASISYLSHEFKAFDKDLCFILTKVNERSRIVGIEQALTELYKQFPTNEVRSFVMTLNQSIQYGSSISPVLVTLSSDIREVQLLNVEEKIGQLSAKMSIPLIMFIMIPIVILITAPGIMRMLG